MREHMCTETYLTARVLCTHNTHTYIDNHVQYTSTLIKMLSCTYLAYIMQHVHRNVINANMQEYVYINLTYHFPSSPTHKKKTLS